MKTGAYRLRTLIHSSTAITEGVIWQQLLLFFFPILFGTFFQQLYNTADAIIVGRFLGKEALSAVGGGTGTVVNLLIGFFTGLSSGGTVIISQFYGAKNKRDVSRAVHTTIALSIAGGAVITVLGVFYAPWMLKLLGTPEEILTLAVSYTRIFFLGILPTIIYNMGAGILRAIGDSRRPLYFLIVGTVLNILLDFLFIAVFKWGVEGAAFATIGSQFITMILVCRCLMKSHESYRLIIKEIRFDPAILKRIIQIGFPAGLQSIMYTVSNLIIQANVNAFGTNTIAAWAAWGKIDSIFWMTINSFGIAVTTFAGQNFGAQKLDRVRKGVVQCFLMAGIGTGLLLVLFKLFGNFFYRLFTTDEAVIEEGLKILNFIAPTFITYIGIEIFSGTIRGCGKSLVPTLLTCGGVCVLRIVWLSVAVPLKPVFTTVCAAYPISWILTTLLFFVYYLILSKRDFRSRQKRP
ncbi:MAG: MATE family efflux transporter [Treponemataceae bacterium]|nr:MATE family efflux transporter [Treponemataceae bacterium]